MEERVSATELARRLRDILGRVRYRGDSFLVERNGAPVARLAPVPGKATTTLRDALAAWRSTGKRDPEFADDLERVGKADRPPDNPLGLVIDTSALVAAERASATWEAALSTLGNEPAVLPAIVCAELLTGVRLARAPHAPRAGGPRSTPCSPRSWWSTSGCRSPRSGQSCSRR